jgi:hypothetical protein
MGGCVTPSSTYPVGCRVRGLSCYDEPFTGVVTGHPGPYSLTLDTGYAVPMSLIVGLAEDEEPGAAPKPAQLALL